MVDKVDTKPRNVGRGGQSFERKRKLPARGAPFGRLLPRMVFDEVNNSITYYHATKGWKKRFLTPQLARTLMRT